MQTATEKLKLSEISPRIMQSEIRAMTVECDRVGGVNLAQGVCDTELPPQVQEAAIRAIRDGFNIYTRLDGIAPLRNAIARKFAHYNRIDADPDAELLVTSGATGALHATVMALLNPGDEVLLFEPLYGYHVNTLLSMRVRPVAVPLAMHTWEIDFDRLEAAVTPNTRAMVLNTPINPCGKVFTRAEMERLAAFATRHDLFVITDEIYEYFLFDGAKHVSMGSLPGMAERTITISGLSKTFSITGWRIGYLRADRRWLGSIAYFHDLTFVCSPSPFQYGAAAGLVELDDTFYAGLSTEYEKKRDLLCGALRDAGLTPLVPTGAYYVLADVSSIPGATAKEKARTLLAKTGIAAVAGTAFFTGGRGEDLLRFCFAKKQPDLERACAALRSL
ncbi:pyridoxal phosphate-dependent aminotransferase [Acidipila rosea]|uniref:Aminotransferase n=1 Tax=Acidipila rosea TaxID=768535 RepID=A0A4R1LG38_9BACT|nr:pyridoxal phosphate-dependent aminotransferase [Acidipila rosea]MBW4025772.1 pyridoxal phosphate-dependent aminotransferase [Acidobacteriota bacterium]MBW4044309.1 pyridoxal phosphate-dependent aminotransferase [Acidobacteriota bacterium]TCK75659.1 aminotransferase [Acidipila rosea]